MLDGIRDPSVEAVLFRTEAVCEELAFLNSLAGADPGGARNAILGFQLRLGQMSLELAASWSTTSEEEKRVEEERSCSS